MRRASFLISAAATVAIAAALPAAASAASGNDIARGHVNNYAGSGSNWDFSAKSNFNGTQPSGTVRITNPNTDPNTVMDGDVTCLNVLGNVASLSGPVTRVQGPVTAFPPQAFVIGAQDSGKFSPSYDLFNGFLGSGPPAGPPTCGNVVPLIPVLDGDIVIADSFGQ